MKTDKTDIIFKKMYKDIKGIEKYYDFKKKEILADKYIENEKKNELIKDLEAEKLININEVKVKHTTKAIATGYSKTTQDISIMLDLEPNFCTRHIKDYIDFIRIPSGTSELFKSYSNFNVIEQIDLSKKKLLFNEDSLYQLIKDNLYEVDKCVSITINNIDSLIEDNEDYYVCKKLAQKFIDSIKGRDKYRTPISDEQFTDIKENNITLLRLDTLRPIISQLILRDKISSARRKLERDLGKKESNLKVDQEKILDAYIDRVKNMCNTHKVLSDLSLLKEDTMTHQTQLIRRANQLQHTRYHLLLPERKQAINLYGIASDSIDMNSIDKDESDEDKSSIKLVISVYSLYDNIEEDIYKYIKKHIKKARESEDF